MLDECHDAKSVVLVGGRIFHTIISQHFKTFGYQELPQSGDVLFFAYACIVVSISHLKMRDTLRLCSSLALNT